MMVMSFYNDIMDSDIMTLIQWRSILKQNELVNDIFLHVKEMQLFSGIKIYSQTVPACVDFIYLQVKLPYIYI